MILITVTLCLIAIIIIANFVPEIYLSCRLWRFEKKLPEITPDTKWRVVTKMKDSDDSLTYVVQYSNDDKEWWPIKSFGTMSYATRYIEEKTKDNKIVHYYDPCSKDDNFNGLILESKE